MKKLVCLLAVCCLFGCGRSAGGAGGSLFCHYEDPFTHTPECKAYTGSGWDEATAMDDCAEPLPSTQASELSAEACDPDTSVGNCTASKGEEDESVIWFYEGDPATFKNGCERFMEGIWASEEEVGATTTTSALLPEAVENCASNDQVAVTPDAISEEQLAAMQADGGHIFFSPRTPVSPAAGFILYPGGRVDPRSYAPAAQLIAKQGYAVAIVPMAEYMAMGESVYRADEVIASHPEITRWFIGGHSIGAVGAGQYAHDALAGGKGAAPLGLVILGSYMDRDHDLSGEDLPVLLLYGDQERIATSDKAAFDEAKAYLPADTIYFPIAGGFHFGFCYSENPRTDEKEGITREEQHEIYTSEIVRFMKSVVGG